MALPPPLDPAHRCLDGVFLHAVTSSSRTEQTMYRHQVAATTHTVELNQIAEINAALASGRRRLTAGSIGAHPPVDERAVLTSLECEGPPSYPYVFGHFEGPAGTGVLRVALHTAHLRAISAQLSLRSQVWGNG
jgi:hypothetical protein